MLLTKTKEQIAWDAHSAALQAIKNHASMNGLGYNLSSHSLMGQLADLIATAVQAGVTEVLKNTYTNEEFEKDIGL
jgi:hypothetical protein